MPLVVVAVVVVVIVVVVVVVFNRQFIRHFLSLQKKTFAVSALLLICNLLHGGGLLKIEGMLTKFCGQEVSEGRNSQTIEICMR